MEQTGSVDEQFTPFAVPVRGGSATTTPRTLASTPPRVV